MQLGPLPASSSRVHRGREKFSQRQDNHLQHRRRSNLRVELREMTPAKGAAPDHARTSLVIINIGGVVPGFTFRKGKSCSSVHSTYCK